MSSIRVGVIGLGSMGRHHARVVRETPGLDLVAVADAYGDPFNVAGELPVLDSTEQIIDSGIDAAVVAVPTIHHLGVALELARADVHTMVEKPIADTVAAAIEIADAFEKRGLVGAVGYVERCNPALVELRRRLEGGELGEVYQISTSRQGPYPERISDVGVVKDLATHDVDLAAWLAGGRYRSVSAQVAYKTGSKHEDMVVAVGKLDNGVITNHIVNWLSPFKDRRTVVTGERGAFIADTATGDLTFHANGTQPTEWEAASVFWGVSEGNSTSFALHRREPLRVEHELFRDAIRGGDSSIVTMREAVETLRVVEALLDSAVSGSVERWM